MTGILLIKSALILARPWADLVVSGAKRWELDSMVCHKRGRIGIIAKGTKTINGTALIVGCTGPLTEAELDAAKPMHLVDRATRLNMPTWQYAWHFAEPERFNDPLPYRHPSGAQTWVTL